MKNRKSNDGGMRIKKIILWVLLVLVLIFAANTTLADFKTPAGEKLYLSNPKNIEVVCTLINLTDYWEKRHTDFPFAAEVREKFLPYQDHPAVKMTADLMKKGWWQIHFFNIAHGITPLPEGKPEIEGEPESKSKWFGMEPVKEYISLPPCLNPENNIPTPTPTTPFWGL